MRFYSPAKINLYLKIQGKRSDGYHELETDMRAIDLFDTIDIEKSEKDSFSCAVLGEDNLVTKARDLFRKKTKVSFPLSITLEKRIPMEAGLGGGSSNAATTLFALNELSARIATLDQLQEWSAELGSDMPFFFSLGAAICRGRGELVENIAFEEDHFWLIKPPVSASTVAIFRKYTKSYGDKNDLEKTAIELIPSLADLKDSLLEQKFSDVTMSGSGTAFFCKGRSLQPLIEGADCFSVKTIQRKPGEWYSLA